MQALKKGGAFIYAKEVSAIEQTVSGQASSGPE